MYEENSVLDRGARVDRDLVKVKLEMLGVLALSQKLCDGNRSFSDEVVGKWQGGIVPKLNSDRRA